MSSKVQKRAASESMLFLSVVGGILVLLNVLAAYLPSPRVDLTRNGLFSLADRSRVLAYRPPLLLFEVPPARP